MFLATVFLATAVLSTSTADLGRRFAQLEARIADLERVAPKDFRVVHYNVLADQYGSNLNPWFLYGADVTSEEREVLLRNFYSKNKPGWPAWAESVLSSGRISAVEQYDRKAFAWEQRRERLWQTVEGSQADVLTLAECDHYDDGEAGSDGFWRAPPEGGGLRELLAQKATRQLGRRLRDRVAREHVRARGDGRVRLWRHIPLVSR